MPDSPDYSKYLPNSVRFSLQDMGELAVRMGSIVTYDRRGEVIFADCFNHGMTPYSYGFTGSGGSGELVISSFGDGAYAAKLRCGTTLNGYVQLQRVNGVFDRGRMGSEFDFVVTATDQSVQLFITAGINAISYSAELKLNISTQKVFIKDNLSGYVEIADMDCGLLAGSAAFPIKLVADFATGKYVRAIFGNVEKDISIYSIPQSVGSDYPFIATIIRFTIDASSPRYNYVTKCIITGNEP